MLILRDHAPFTLSFNSLKFSVKEHFAVRNDTPSKLGG